MSESKHTVRCDSNVATLREAIMKRPRNAFVSQVSLDEQWQALGYTSAPNLERAEEEFGALVSLLEAEGVRLHFMPEDPETDPDSLYTHDGATAVPDGLILCRMGKLSRANEPAAVQRFAAAGALPIAGRIKAPGLLEGGDLVWLDNRTVAIGIGYRSNEEGARQFQALTDLDVVRVHLPHWNGPSDVLHLMSLISPIDTDLALIFRRLLPVVFLQELAERGYRLIDVPEGEFESLGCNVLALGPRRCLVVGGNPVTTARLENAGCQVVSFSGVEIALKGLGGPTCLTRPIVRF